MECTEVWNAGLASAKSDRRIQFDEAYRKLAPALRSIAMYRGGVSPADAGDFVNEVFLRVWSKLEEFRGECPLKGWIYQFAYNQAKNERKRLRLQLDVNVHYDSVPCGVTKSPEERALHGEAEAQWMLVLEQFPEVERRLAIAWWLMDGNVSEAARLCEMDVRKAQQIWSSFHEKSERVFKRLQRTGWKR